MILQHKMMLSVAAAGMMIASTGCATKGHVRAKIAPVEAKLGEVEKRAGQAEADIDAVEKQLSQTGEVATGAEREAKAAKEAAATADGKAVTAGQRADGAYNLAEKTSTRLGETEKSIDRMYDNLDNYQLVKSDSITFGFNKSELTKEMKAKLDEFASSIQQQKKFVIEVQGFTDPAGSPSYNQELARRRATNVVRYMTVTHNIPLRRIQMLGVGSENPVGDNKTREGRMQNRRVEIKVFALPAGRSESAASGVTTTAKSLE